MASLARAVGHPYLAHIQDAWKCVRRTREIWSLVIDEFAMRNFHNEKRPLRKNPTQSGKGGKGHHESASWSVVERTIFEQNIRANATAFTEPPLARARALFPPLRWKGRQGRQGTDGQESPAVALAARRPPGEFLYVSSFPSAREGKVFPFLHRACVRPRPPPPKIVPKRHSLARSSRLAASTAFSRVAFTRTNESAPFAGVQKVISKSEFLGRKF